jgi:acyl-CoA thioesterase I
MLPLLTQALRSRHYALVLWQTGTVEAVRGMQPDVMQAVLEAGVDAVREAGGDVVLVDPQFSRFLRANTDLDPYESVLEQVADLPGVVLFPRFELMRSWASEGSIDLENVQQSDRETAVAQLNICLGQALARFVLNGVDLAAH